MRIIAGRFRGAVLKSPKGKIVRPTKDRVREAVFSILKARKSLDGLRVLDLFAGTGALGFEALSRGAGHVVFVEATSSVLGIAKANAQVLGVEGACTFVKADVLVWLQKPARNPFDLIFADPPYDLEDLPSLPALAHPHLATDGLMILEHGPGNKFDDAPFHVMSRAYGKTVVSMFAA